MPRPAEHPDWATAPSSPTHLVRPPSSRIADGWNVAERPPAQFFNWWQNLVGKWTHWLEDDLNAKNTALDARLDNMERRIVADEWTYPAPKLRTVLLAPDDGMDGTLDPAVLPGWVRASNILGPGIYFPIRARTTEAAWIWRLHLPQGATLRRVRALVSPNVARATLTDRMALAVYSAELRFTAPLGPTAGTLTPSARDNGAMGLQVLDAGALTLSADPLRTVYARVDAGGTAGADVVHGLQVQFDDAGPRNV